MIPSCFAFKKYLENAMVVGKGQIFISKYKMLSFHMFIKGLIFQLA